MISLTDPITGNPVSEKDLVVLKAALTLFNQHGPRHMAQKGYPPELARVINEIVAVAFSGGFLLALSYRDNPDRWKDEIM